MVATRRLKIEGDAEYYHHIAALLADGEGFIAVEPFLQNGISVPWAVHPPAWPLVLAGPALFGFRSFPEQQAFATLIGAGTVVATGLAGRRIAGFRAGLIAAAIAAIYPFFWRYERELMSETLVLFFVALVLLLAYGFWYRPSLARAVAVAALCGVLALTRAELALLVVALLIPIVLLAPAVPWRHRVRWLSCAVVVWTIVIAPWVVYNSTRFAEPVFLTHSFGYNLSVANCDLTYSGPNLGWVDLRCLTRRESGERIVRGRDFSSLDAGRRRDGIAYLRDHKSRVPLVVLARIGRAWGLYHPLEQRDLEPDRGSPTWVTWAAIIAYWLLLPAAAVGAIVLRRKHVPLFPVLAFVVISILAVAVTFGYSRFRGPAEVSIVLLAAVAAESVLPRRESTTGDESQVLSVDDEDATPRR